MLDLDVEYFALFTALAVLLWFIWNYKKQNHFRLPPGPVPLPVVGNLYAHFIGKPERDLPTIKKDYGEITLYYGGPFRIVFLNTIEAVKEAFITNGQVISHRGSYLSFTTSHINRDLKGILESDYTNSLKENRKLSLAIFRSLGVGRSTMEAKIIEEGERLCETIRGFEGKEFDPWQPISCSVANVILSVVLNKQYNHGDSELLEILKNTDDMIAIGKHLQFIDCMNFLRFVPPFRGSFQLMESCDKRLKEYVSKAVKDHLKEFEIGQSSDFVDIWIEKNYDGTKYMATFDEDDLVQVVRDMLLAGTETTATSLKWSIFQLANYPEIQSKIHEEMNRVFGKDKVISLEDKDHLPYLEAFIWEVQRSKTIVPLSLPHCTKVNTKLRGFDIPANTVINANLMGIHMDEDVFQEPRVFRPERFLDSQGRFIKHPNIIPFGIGKRSCIGEILARQELFLFNAVLTQRFKFVFHQGTCKINEEGVPNFVYCPQRFKIRAIPI